MFSIGYIRNLIYKHSKLYAFVMDYIRSAIDHLPSSIPDAQLQHSTNVIKLKTSDNAYLPSPKIAAALVSLTNGSKQSDSIL